MDARPRNTGLKLLAIIAALVFTTWVYYPYSPAGRQSREIERARIFLAPIEAKLTSDERFKDIHARATTQVQIAITGQAANVSVFEELKQFVDARYSQESEISPILLRINLEDPSNPKGYRVLEATFERKGK